MNSKQRKSRRITRCGSRDDKYTFMHVYGLLGTVTGYNAELYYYSGIRQVAKYHCLHILNHNGQRNFIFLSFYRSYMT